MGEGLKRAFSAAKVTRIKPKRNAVIIDFLPDGIGYKKVISIECKDGNLQGMLEQEAGWLNRFHD
jgi:hypothetical protein